VKRPDRTLLEESKSVAVHCAKCSRRLLVFACWVDFQDEGEGQYRPIGEAGWVPNDASRETGPHGPKFRFACRCGSRPQVLQRTLEKHGYTGERARLDI